MLWNIYCIFENINTLQHSCSRILIQSINIPEHENHKILIFWNMNIPEYYYAGLLIFQSIIILEHGYINIPEN